MHLNLGAFKDHPDIFKLVVYLGYLALMEKRGKDQNPALEKDIEAHLSILNPEHKWIGLIRRPGVVVAVFLILAVLVLGSVFIFCFLANINK